MSWIWVRGLSCIRGSRPADWTRLSKQLRRLSSADEPQRWKVKTIPNAITLTRIAVTPYIGYTIIAEQYHLSFVLTAVAAATDLLDGYIARVMPSQQSNLGALIDPMADKILIGVLTVALTYNQLLPLPLTILFLSRDAALMIGTFVMRYRALPNEERRSRLFNLSDCDTQIKATEVSKWNTGLQLLLIGATMGAPLFNYVDSWPLQLLWATTTVTTVWSGMQYWQRRANLHPNLGPKRRGDS